MHQLTESHDPILQICPRVWWHRELELAVQNCQKETCIWTFQIGTRPRKLVVSSIHSKQFASEQVWTRPSYLVRIMPCIPLHVPSVRHPEPASICKRFEPLPDFAHPEVWKYFKSIKVHAIKWSEAVEFLNSGPKRESCETRPSGPPKLTLEASTLPLSWTRLTE